MWESQKVSAQGSQILWEVADVLKLANPLEKAFQHGVKEHPGDFVCSAGEALRVISEQPVGKSAPKNKAVTEERHLDSSGDGFAA